MTNNVARNIDFNKSEDTIKSDDVVFMAPPQKNRDALLFEIYFEERINSTKLANRLSVSLSNLNAIIKKINFCDEKPIQEIKIGKYKVFCLTEEGRKYVQDSFLKFLCSDDSDFKNIKQLQELMDAFKDYYTDGWVDFIKNKWCQEENPKEMGEGVDAFEEAMRVLSKIYINSKEKYDMLLNLVLNDKEARIIVSDYMSKKIKEYKKYGHLAVWIETDCKGLYEVIDWMFQLLSEGKDYDCSDVSKDLMSELNQVKSDMLLGLLNNWDKSDILSYWFQQEMETPLAYYMAEKYYYLGYCLRKKMYDSEKV